jgi:hypothetical protein
VRPVATTKDLLQQATTAADGERLLLLAGAEDAARRSGDWQAVAEAWAALGNATAAERCLVRALQGSGHDIWDYRRAAATRALLGDHQAAVATLAMLEAAFLGRVESNGLRWRLLAEGYAELQDLVGARRCLDAGRERATTVDDLCALAKAHAELVADRETARRLLEMAETSAATAVDRHGVPDVGAWWTTAIAWSELLQDDVRAQASLEAGLARAADVSGCLTMARAWSCEEPSQQQSDAFQRCLDKARGFASTFEAWCEIAETMHELGGDVEAVRDALARAEALVTTPAERRRLVQRRRACLPDAESGAEPVADSEPAGLLPQELAESRLTASGWMLDAGALLEWLRPRLTEAMLTAIAEEDHGYDRDENFAVLQDIARSGRVPVPLEWVPREVMELSRWAEGLHVDHVQRAFCATVLCLAELTAERFGSIEANLAILLESCAILGGEALVRAEGLLVALSERPGCEPSERAFATLGLLLAAVQRDPQDPRLAPLAAHLLALDAELVRSGDYAHPEHGFVLGATHFDTAHAVWKRLVHHTFAEWRDDPGRPTLTEVVRRLRA